MLSFLDKMLELSIEVTALSRLGQPADLPTPL